MSTFELSVSELSSVDVSSKELSGIDAVWLVSDVIMSSLVDVTSTVVLSTISEFVSIVGVVAEDVSALLQAVNVTSSMAIKVVNVYFFIIVTSRI